MADEAGVDVLKRIFVERLGIEPPDDHTDLIETGLLDSLMLVELILALEEQFGIRIDLTTVDLDDLRTLTRLEALLRRGRSVA